MGIKEVRQGKDDTERAENWTISYGKGYKIINYGMIFVT